MDDHGLAVDIGKWLARQTGRGHPGGYQDQWFAHRQDSVF
jgi:hypothetical protein